MAPVVVPAVALVTALSGCASAGTGAGTAAVVGSETGGAGADGTGADGVGADVGGRQVLATAQRRAVDPCTLFTDAEVRALLGVGSGSAASSASGASGVRRTPGGASGSTCTLAASAGRRSLRIALHGSAETAPAVFRERRSFGEEAQPVPGVGRAAFAVFRPDEVGLVVLTSRTVLSVSLLSSTARFTAPPAELARITPVVQQAAARL